MGRLAGAGLNLFAPEPLFAAATLFHAGAGGTPLPEVSVTITVQGNQGSFTLAGDTTRVTGSDGIATFPDLSLDKPGGYVFLATSTLVGFAPAQVSSELFHITF